MSGRTNAFGLPIGEEVPGWAPRLLPPRSPMTGGFVDIVPLDPAAHGEALWSAYAANPDGRNWTYLFVERPASQSEFDAYLAAQAKPSDPFAHTIIDRATGQPVGMASFMRIDPNMGCIEVGNINFSDGMKQTIGATEAMFLMMCRVFDELGYRRYEWKCDSLNAPSRAAALRLGFAYEGLFRQAIVYKGRNRDTTWYAIIDREWPAIKAAFQAWLAPSNFSSDGRQKKRLGDFTAAARQSLAG